MALEPFEPLHIFQTRILDGGDVGIDAITAQGRRITAVVPRWNSTAEGIRAALYESGRAQLRADAVLLAVRESWAADEREPYAVDDTDTDATPG